VWTIIRQALAGASAPVRRTFWHVGVFWGLALALQIWDSRNGQGVAGLAEIISAVFGICGIALLGVAHSLHLAMREVASRQQPAAGADHVQRVLLVLPILGFVAGVALGIAALMMVLRVALGTEWPFGALAFMLYGGMTLFAGRAVTDTTSTLYRFGVAQAEAAAALRADVTTARLDGLQARMNPHMLFNALNTVASLVRTNPVAAEQVIEDLGDVLRAGLNRSATTSSTVRDEVAYVKAWLAIEQARWGEALRVRWAIAEDVLACAVPPFVIQPLVENALRHGLGTRVDGGEIRISVQRTATALHAVVEDSGSGFPPRWREGMGLSNLRQRLAAQYGDAAAVVIADAVPGARVEVRVPIAGDT
jgi:Histidine kinase/Histidine kinase-, DNA gyrase B-, and HSP90-like ATPase